MRGGLGRAVRVVVVRGSIGCVTAGLCVAAALGGSTARAQHQVSSPRPNIILITTDDQTLADLAVMHHVLNRLGQRGTTFVRAFSPDPLCCPARATILTGQYAHNTHVLGNLPPYGGFTAFDDSSTLAVWLREGGYNTAIIGKYLNGYPTAGASGYVPPGWGNWRVPVKGIYNYRRWTLNENGSLVAYSGRYETNVVADEARSLVEHYAPARRPYFLWAGFLAPHEGRPVEADDPSGLLTPAVSDRNRDALSALPLPAKASINEADVSDKPVYVQTTEPHPLVALRELYQQRLESLLSVDGAVNRLLDAVKASGELSNTVIIFTSDNGFLVGEHRRTGKVVGYEESTRVPLIVAGPGFNTGQTRNQKVGLVDIAPTIAAAANVTPQLVQDGLPLGDFVRSRHVGRARPILLQAAPNDGHTSRWYTGIRTNRYVYIRYNTGEKELYDLTLDPLQLHNLAVLSPGIAVQLRLSRALVALRNCSGLTCHESVATLAATQD